VVSEAVTEPSFPVDSLNEAQVACSAVPEQQGGVRLMESHKSRAVGLLPLQKAFTTLRTDSEAKVLLRALFTSRELKELENRWLSFQLLLAGYTQRDVRAELSISNDTVSRSARTVHQYQKAVETLLSALTSRLHVNHSLTKLGNTMDLISLSHPFISEPDSMVDPKSDSKLPSKVASQAAGPPPAITSSNESESMYQEAEALLLEFDAKFLSATRPRPDFVQKLRKLLNSYPT
jgi:uncharacterized protein YerC